MSEEERKPGRTSKYNENVHQVIVEALRDGNRKEVAARLAGIHPDTFHDWMRQADLEPHKVPWLVALKEDVDQALAEWEAGMVKVVVQTAQSGAPNTWQAAMTALERRLPQHYGKRDTVKVEADQPLFQLNQVIVEDANAREITRGFLSGLVAGRADEPIGLGAGSEPTTVETD